MHGFPFLKFLMRNLPPTMILMVTALFINMFIIHIASNDYKVSDDDKQL